MSIKRPYALSIAGFDPSGGAGVLADCKTFEAQNVQGMAVITGNTIQTENELKALYWQHIDCVSESISTILSAYKFRAIKIGIVPHAAFLMELLLRIKAIAPSAFILWDPVLKSSSDYPFFDIQSLEKFPQLWNYIDLITPNTEEFDLLKKFIPEEFDNALFIKGGHRTTRKGLDILKTKKEDLLFPPGKENIRPKHGSGCVLSSALIAQIALGKPLTEACYLAKKYVSRYLASTSTLLGTHDLH